MADDLRANLDQLLLQARQQAILDRLRRRQRAQQVAEIVGQRMKPRNNRVGRERTAARPCPSDRVFAFFDPLFARAAFVAEGDDIPESPRHVGDDEAGARRTRFVRQL